MTEQIQADGDDEGKGEGADQNLDQFHGAGVKGILNAYWMFCY
jgi:hypothetical protein